MKRVIRRKEKEEERNAIRAKFKGPRSGVLAVADLRLFAHLASPYPPSATLDSGIAAQGQSQRDLYLT
jgi:hypothetical protein